MWLVGSAYMGSNIVKIETKVAMLVEWFTDSHVEIMSYLALMYGCH